MGMKDLYLYSTEVTGAVYNLVLPEGMQNVNFNSCQGLKGSVDKLALLEGKCRTWTSAAAGASQAHFPPPKGQRSRTTAARKRTSKLCGNEVCILINEPTARCKKKALILECGVTLARSPSRGTVGRGTHSYDATRAFKYCSRTLSSPAGQDAQPVPITAYFCCSDLLIATGSPTA